MDCHLRAYSHHMVLGRDSVCNRPRKEVPVPGLELFRSRVRVHAGGPQWAVTSRSPMEFHPWFHPCHVDCPDAPRLSPLGTAAWLSRSAPSCRTAHPSFVSLHAPGSVLREMEDVTSNAIDTELRQLLFG